MSDCHKLQPGCFANVCGEAPWLGCGCDCKLSSLRLKIKRDSHTSLSEAAARFRAQGAELLRGRHCTWSRAVHNSANCEQHLDTESKKGVGGPVKPNMMGMRCFSHVLSADPTGEMQDSPLRQGI